jgi:hypothetical protein
VTLETAVALIALGASLLSAGRLAFVTEERVATLRTDVDKLKGMAEEFNGPARAKHVELMGRVDSIEKQALKFATTEAVAAVGARVDAGFKHLEDLIKSERRERHGTSRDDV